jgi:hypothetical protein
MNGKANLDPLLFLPFELTLIAKSALAAAPLPARRVPARRDPLGAPAAAAGIGAQPRAGRPYRTTR